MLTKLAFTNDLQSQDPTIFGSHGGASRVFSLLDVTFGLGGFLGPLIAGTLAGTFGFSIMVFVLGECFILCRIREEEHETNFR